MTENKPGFIKRFFKKTWRAIKFTARHTTALSIKTVFFTIVFILAVAAAGWFAFVKYVNPDQVAALVAKKLQESFDRPVVLGSVDLKFFNSIEINRLEILGGEIAPETSFFTAERVVINYSLMPLLRGKIQLDEILIEAPAINVIIDKNGANNVPRPRVSGPRLDGPDAASSRAASAGMLSFGGRDFGVYINDWTVRNATVSFNDLQHGVAHKVEKFDTHLDNLDFTRLSPFKTSFVMKNDYKDRVIETVFKGEGRVNFASFDWPSFSVRGLNMDILFLDLPVKINADLDNLRTPFISFTAHLPAVKGAELGLFFDAPPAVNIPAVSLKASTLYNRRARRLGVEKGALAAHDIEVNFSGAVNFPGGAEFSFTTNSFDAGALGGIFAVAEKLALSGSVSAQGKLLFNNGKFDFAGGSADVKSAGFKARGFTVDGMDARLRVDGWYHDISADIKTGNLDVEGTKFTNVRGAVLFKDNQLLADVKSAELNGSPIKITTDILDFNDDEKRQINSNFYFETFSPMEIIDVVRDFVVAITQKREFMPRHSGEMAWLRNIRSGLPKFMPNFKGVIVADKFSSPPASGVDFNAEFDLKNLLSGMENLDGKIDAQMKNGVVYRLEEKAADEKIWGVAFQPFIIMHRMEKAGTFKTGTILKDVAYDNITASVDLQNGTMNIVNAYGDGGTIGLAAKGGADWVNETMDITIWTIFRNTSRSGVLAQNMTDASGAPALAFRVRNKMNAPSVEILRPRTVGEEIKAAKTRGIRTNFAAGRRFRDAEE